MKFWWTLLLLASVNGLAPAQDATQIQSLYVTRPVRYVYRTYEENGKTKEDTTSKKIAQQINDDKVVIILNVNSHAKKVSPLKIFSSRLKYEILISNDDDYIAEHKVQVYFGGDDQYAFFVNKDEPIIGKIGEVVIYKNVSVYAGGRDDPAVFDRTGFEYFMTNLCELEQGLRCADQGAPANDFKGKNVGSIIVEFPIAALTGQVDPKLGQIRVWAKVHKEK